MLFVCGVFAQQVSVQRAKEVAKNMYIESFAVNKTINDLEVVSEVVYTMKEIPVFYIFNMNKGGFVIVSSDERTKPVLGYSSESVFDMQDMPCCVHWLFEQYAGQIIEFMEEEVNTNNYESHPDWLKLENPNFQKSTQELLAVSPLLTTTWSQGCYYNAMCPADASLGTNRCGRCPTGCVATAFSQVLKYHNYPTNGVGSKTYTHATYGTLSANFAATTYDWASMPNKLLSDNQAAATLLYHAGISINMDYGPNGSSAYTTDVRKALVNNFKYASSTQYVYKSSYTDVQWVNLIRAELDAQRVVLISGYDPNAKAGHGFVCDGYQNTDYFHINWGWNGSADGYFYLNALNPSSYAFNSNVGAIIGIKPSTTPTTCSGQQTLTANSGTVSDGSGSNDYANNLDCKWLIKPTNAGSVTLTFTAFNTENSYDFVKIYDGETTSAPLLGTYSGSNLPPQLIATSGKMLIHFTSDNSQVFAGWSANYSGNPVTTYCNGTTTLTAATGTITDGSGSKDYSNNSDCYWLINPTDAASVKLKFNSFKTESGNDKLYIYDGTTTNDPLLATYSGTNTPAAVTASSGKMLVRFVTNSNITKAGWSASYTSQKAFCSGTTTFTSNSGTITDGSGSQYYDNNANCKWLIKPTGAGSVKLTFTAFNTEAGVDLVKIYNGETTSAPLLATYSGSSIPAAVTANSGKMLVHFTSNASVKKPGFTANYQKLSKEETGIEHYLSTETLIQIIPNPSNGYFIIKVPEDISIKKVRINDILGKTVYSMYFGAEKLDEYQITHNLSNGIYYVVIDCSEGSFAKKIMVNNGR